MDNLIFSLNATMPLFLLMALGYVLRNTGFFDDAFTAKTNQYVFKIALPVLLFCQMADKDFFEMWDWSFILYCLAASVLVIMASILISGKCAGPGRRGEFVQASYRSNAALLGVSFVENIYGNAGITPLMMLAVLPLYNVTAVILLTVMKPGSRGTFKETAVKAAHDIITNRLIWGILLGIIVSVSGVPKPKMVMTGLKYISNTATPLGLMVVGAGFNFKKALGAFKPTAVIAFLKLFAWCAIFLPPAVMLGFTHDKLLALLIMLGSPTAVASYVMAVSMGHEGVITSGALVLTTLLSAFTLTVWVFVLFSLGLV